MEEALAARLDRPARIGHAAVASALELFNQSGAAMSMGEAARRVGLSHRRFIQLFTRQVGLTPRLYCRILRFQRAREALARIAAPDWATLAVRCGYFDQSHLIRDFREFCGLNPTQYLRDRSDRALRNHVPILPPVNFFQYGRRNMPQNR
jgi:transcriptional regulator GlxA family with amidase domain